MIASQKVLLHHKESQETLNWERLSWDAVSPMVDNQRNVVPLKQHAEIY